MADMHINDNKGWKYKWTKEEDDIIKKYYPQNGYQYIEKILPNRNRSGIQSRASKLGVRYLSYDLNYFNKIDTPTKAYWLGFLYADGYITSNYRWGLELSYNDIDHMRSFLKEFKCNINIRTRNRDGNESCSFQIKNRKVYEDLHKLGLERNKTYNLKFPNCNVLTEKYYSHFIRGFFDGDGCISFNIAPKIRKDRNNKIYNKLSKEVNFVCQSSDFLLKIQEILLENNIEMYYGVNKNHNNLPYIRTAKMENIISFYNYIYKDSNNSNRLERKYLKFNDLFIATTNGDISKKIS